MHEYNRRNVEEFFEAIDPILTGYKYINFSYIALKNGDGFDLVQGRLQLQGVQSTIKLDSFKSKNIRAGAFNLAETNLNPRSFVDVLLSGKLQTPHGELLFKVEENRDYSSYCDLHHRDGLVSQRRQLYMCINGARRPRIDSISLDWEVKATSTPFFNFQELCDEFSVGTPKGDSGSVEIIAFNLAAVSSASAISGAKAKLVIDLAEGLKRHASAIGYRVLRNKILTRGILNGSDLKWENVENVQRGTSEIEVPPGAMVDCVASYDGIAHSHYWLIDPQTAQNPFRAVHNAFDNNLEVLQALIGKAQMKGANARDLEVAVAWLLWILGFSATHIGGTPKTSDAPDLIAATPQGNLLVIECTTGILKEDNKMAHLVERTEKIRQSRAAVGHGQVHLGGPGLLGAVDERGEVEVADQAAHEQHGGLEAVIVLVAVGDGIIHLRLHICKGRKDIVEGGPRG